MTYSQILRGVRRLGQEQEQLTITEHLSSSQFLVGFVLFNH